MKTETATKPMNHLKGIPRHPGQVGDQPHKLLEVMAVSRGIR